MATPAAGDTQGLAARIERAFAQEARPGPEELTDSTYGEEPAALVLAFQAVEDWRGLDAGFLDQAPDGWATSLSFFSGKALRYFLPAYLLADLRDELLTQDPSFRLCHAVTPLGGSRKIAAVWGGGTLGERAREDFAPLTPEQVAVITDYLWWKLEQAGYDPVIEQALEHYWLPRRAQES